MTPTNKKKHTTNNKIKWILDKPTQLKKQTNNATQHNTSQHSTPHNNTPQSKQHNTTQHNTTQHNTTQHNNTTQYITHNTT